MKTIALPATHPSGLTQVRFGRKRPVGLGPHLRLSNYLRQTLPTPPNSTDWSPAALSSLRDIMGNDQLGDCHDAQTEVLTERGWKKWPEYDGSSLLGTMNQTTGFLEFQEPISLTRREHKGRMAYASHKRLDFALTQNHRMIVSPYYIPKPYVSGTSGYGRQSFVSIDDLPHRSLMPGSTNGFIGTTLERLSVGSRSWDGSDFLRLISVVISDGYVRSGPNKNVISFCCFREDRRDMVAALAHRLEIHEQPSRRGVWSFADADLAEWLRVNAYVGDVHRSQFKRVPDLVKVASQDQIEEFFKFFGDQTHDVPDGQGRMFSTTSPKLADDIQELLLRCGSRSSLYKRTTMRVGTYLGKKIVGHSPEISICENASSDISLLRSNIEWDEYDGEVFCATVPNSTLITRRNGSVLISGNCVIASRNHGVGTATGNAGDLFHPTLAKIIAEYSAITGYVPGDPSTDQGTDEVTAQNYWKTHGFLNGTKPLGAIAIDATNRTEVMTAIWLFEGADICMELPDAFISPFPSSDGFTWSATTPDDNNGHCVQAIGYNSNGVTIDTWALFGTLTWNALAKLAVPAAPYYGSIYVTLTTDLLIKGQSKVPAGVDWSSLIADFDTMGGNVPVPTPVTPPAPVPPAPPGTGVSLAQAQSWANAALASGHPLLTRAQAEALVTAGLAKNWPKS